MKPNLVFILADDMGYGDFGAKGSVYEGGIRVPLMMRCWQDEWRY